MAVWTNENSVITQKGHELLAKLGSGHMLRFTRAAGAAGTVPADQLYYLNELDSQCCELTLANPVHNGRSIILSVEISNIGVSEGFSLSQIGVFADDPDLGEILFFIAQTDIPEEIPAFTVAPDFSINFNFKISIGNVSEVNIDFEPSSLSTKSDLQNLCARIEELERLFNNGIIDGGNWDDDEYEGDGFESAIVFESGESGDYFESARVDFIAQLIDGGIFSYSGI